MKSYIKKGKQRWFFLSVSISFLCLFILIGVTDLNYEQETTYRDLQIKTFELYSNWNNYTGRLKGLLITTSDFKETLEGVKKDKESIRIHLDQLKTDNLSMPSGLQKSMISFIASIEGGLLLGQDIEESAWLLLNQPDLPLGYKEGKIGLYSLTGKDAITEIGPLSAYFYYQLVNQIKGLNTLFDRLFSDRLNSLLVDIAQETVRWQKFYFSFRFALLFLTAGIISITIALLFSMNRYLRKLADSTQSELLTTQSHLNEAQHFLDNAQFQRSLFEMVAGISHELNTPLGNCVSLTSHIKSYVDQFFTLIHEKDINVALLEHDLVDVKEGFQLIEKNLDHMRVQINTFKRLSSVNEETEGSFVLLDEYLVQELPKLLITIAPNFKICVDTHNTNGVLIPFTYANTILSQLINNAYEHGKTNEACLCCTLHNNELVIEFRDNGIGVPKESIERLAEPFYTTARGDRHMGLGLSIIASLISNKLKGTIDFKNSDTGLVVRMQFLVQQQG